MIQLNAHEIHQLFCRGESSAEKIVSSFLAHQEAHEPVIKAFITPLRERALEKARALDIAKAKGAPMGRLAGVPVALKDLIHLKGEITTCGSKFLTNYRAPFDATACRLVEEAGGIFIGKTNLDEFGMGSSTENSAFFPTRNPWNKTCVPGGSSGGSAAAVAARMAPLGIGTDTGGSIRQPAALCGLVGFKPTYGRVSRYGLVSYASSLDHIGPFANSVKDCAMIMEVIGQHCIHDSTSVAKRAEEYTKQLRTDLKGVKIAVPWHFLEGMKEEPLAHFRESIKRLESLGATIIDVNLDILKHSLSVYYVLATAEASTNLARFDGIRYGVRAKDPTSLHDLVERSRSEGFGKEVVRRILLGTYVLSAGHKDAFYRKAQCLRTLIVQRFNEVFGQADLIAMPTSPTEAFALGAIQEPLEMYLADIYTIAANIAGVPAISIPSGLSRAGLPFGLQLLGAQLEDGRVLAAAHAFEQGLPKHLPKEVFA